MTFQQLVFACEVANQGSYGKAAQKLYTHQSNISTAIKQLEDEFGITLFLRSTKGIQVTEEGEEFLAYAKEILNQKIFIENIYAIRKTDSKQRFTLSSMRAFFLVEFARWMENRQNYYQKPGYYRLIKRSFRNVFTDVSGGHADLGIVLIQKAKEHRIKKLASINRLEFTKLGESHLNLVVRDGHPAISQGLDKISSYPYVLSEENEKFSHLFDESADSALKLFNNAPSTIISTNDSLACEEIIAETDAFYLSTVPRRKTSRYNCISIPYNQEEAAVCFFSLKRIGYTLPDDVSDYISELQSFFLENRAY